MDPRTAPAPGERLHEWIRPVSAFVGSRVAYVLYVLGISAFVLGTGLSGGGRSFGQPWGTFLGRALFNSDSGFYYSIAIHGYAHVPFSTAAQYNWAFFPLYPWLTRAAGAILGSTAVIPAGYVIASASFLVALWALGRWVSDSASPTIAQFAVLLAAFNPLTPYFLAYRAASLFFLLSVLTLWATGRRRWGWALLFGALASLARPTGILLAIPYAFAVWMDPDLGMARRVQWFAGAAAFVLGFAAVGFIDLQASGNPLAFLQIQAAWQRAAGAPFLAALRWLVHPGQALAVQGGWALPPLAIAFTAAAGLLALWMLQRRTWWPWAWYLGLVVIFANSSNSFEGIPRFIVELPPLYLGLAAWAEERHWKEGVLVGTIALFGLYIVLWTLGVHAVQS